MKRVVKYINYFFMILLLTEFVACGGGTDGNSGAADISVTGITLNKNNTSILSGSNEQLTVTIAPMDATNTNVTWESSDPSIASVTSGGLVTGISIGNAIITVKTVDGNKTATCNVTVTDTTVSVISVTLDKTSSNIEIDGTIA